MSLRDRAADANAGMPAPTRRGAPVVVPGSRGLSFRFRDAGTTRHAEIRTFRHSLRAGRGGSVSTHCPVLSQAAAVGCQRAGWPRNQCKSSRPQRHHGLAMMRDIGETPGGVGGPAWSPSRDTTPKLPRRSGLESANAA